MKKLNKFLIFIPTYNRNDLLNETIGSIINQKYKNFILYISDNQSDVPVVDTIPKEYLDMNFIFIERQNIFYPSGVEHVNSVLPSILDKLEFDFFVNLADDDCLLDYILLKINFFADDYKYICTNFITYYQNQEFIEYPIYEDEYYVLNSYNQLFYNCTNAGILGMERKASKLHYESEKQLSINSHVSSIFIHRDILRDSLSKYNIITVNPFGDVGYGLLAIKSERILFLSKPMMIARIFSNYGMSGSEKGKRLALKKHHNFYTKDRPIKAISFANGSYISYAELLDKLGIPYNKKHPSISMLLRHFREIVYDSPRTKVTYGDAKEILYKIFTINNLINLFKFTYKKFFSKKNDILKKIIITNITDVNSIYKIIKKD